MVGRWGAPPLSAAEQAGLLNAGAGGVGTTLTETREHLVRASASPQAATPTQAAA